MLIETDPLGVRVAWSTPTGGRDHAHLSAMSTPQIELVLSIFREEGTELTAKPSCEVLNRLAVALDPQARLQALLGMAPS